jgi:hypothetical protein
MASCPLWLHLHLVETSELLRTHVGERDTRKGREREGEASRAALSWKENQAHNRRTSQPPPPPGRAASERQLRATA